MKKLILSFCWLCLLASPAQAETLSIACAANFTAAMKELAEVYSGETGIEVRTSFGSTGMLYGQITKGAPYDLFFAADERRPAMLHEQGLSLPPVLYAKGRVVVWSKQPDLASMPNWKEAILSTQCARVGIATPATAPYGLKAEEAMKAVGILDEVTPKLAFGKSVGTAFQYAYSTSADASFVALSQAISDKGADGTFWPIPEAGAVNQAACVLTSGKQGPATDFLNWLDTEAARTVITRYGYE